MTLTALDAVVSDDRCNFDKTRFAHDCHIAQSSQQFMAFIDKTVAVGVAEGLILPEAKALIRTAMIAALQAGYKTHEQEIAARELEAFFGTTDEIPPSVRPFINAAAAQQTLPRM